MVVAGAGFTGCAVAIHLARIASSKTRIVLVDPDDPGPGFSHRSPHPEHRLNGADAIHILYPDDPSHFARHLRETGALEHDPAAIAPSGFVFARRSEFGKYVAGEVSRHSQAGSIDYLRGQVAAIEPLGAQLTVGLEDGRRLRADVCVIATGWAPPSTPAPVSALSAHRRWIGNPWQADRLQQIPQGCSVLIIGNGLSAADVVTTLMGQGHRGPIQCVSRHGLRPASQNPYRSTESFWERITDPAPAFIRRHGVPSSLTQVLDAYRRDLLSLDRTRSSWHVPFDELRDAVPAFWPCLPTSDKRRFMRHLKSRYDALRYRYPPQTERVLQGAMDGGQLTFLKVRIRAASDRGRELCFQARDPESNRIVELRADYAINCTSTEPTFLSGSRLFRQMAKARLVRQNAMGGGADVSPSGELIDVTGRPNGNLYVFGPPSIMSVGEISAVPFITRQIVRALPALAKALNTASLVI